MLEILAARTLSGLSTGVTLTIATAKLRFQIAPGGGSGLGITDARYSLCADGVEFASGQTDANGEVRIPLLPLFSGTVVLRVFGTEYNLSLHPKLQASASLPGQQKRLDILGYMTGYQLLEIANDVPDDGRDGARTQQAIMNIQTDKSLRIDGEMGPQTTGALRIEVGD